jgi:hypothetical protein
MCEDRDGVDELQLAVGVWKGRLEAVDPEVGKGERFAAPSDEAWVVVGAVHARVLERASMAYDATTAAAEVEEGTQPVEGHSVCGEDLADAGRVPPTALVVLLDVEMPADRADELWLRKRQAVEPLAGAKAGIARTCLGVKEIAETGTHVVDERHQAEPLQPSGPGARGPARRKERWEARACDRAFKPAEA